MIRDIAMASSGLLSNKMFGPPVMPYQPEGVWGNFVNQGDADHWTLSPGEDRYRRGLYTFVRRSARYPSLAVFDAPTREFCTARRTKSDTPLQALATLNDPLFWEAAGALARRMASEPAPGAPPAERIALGFRAATGRRPRGAELRPLLALYERRRAADGARPALHLVGNVLLNLDETLSNH